MTLTERTAYIKGLCEGLGLDKKDTPEAKIINALLELCEEMALEIEDIESDIGELADYCEELDEDLGDVEEFVYECFEDDDCDCCCDDDDCDCCDDECIEVTCPACEEAVCIGLDEIDEEGEVECPCCGAILEFEIEEEEEIEE